MGQHWKQAPCCAPTVPAGQAQWLFWQIWPGAPQTKPQALQLYLSLLTSRQTVPQRLMFWPGCGFGQQWL
jgi:hypothetical protein